MKYPFPVPENKRIRVIITTDAANEADDQFAIVHALLSPKLIIKGLAAVHFGTKRGDTMQKSYDEIQKLLGLMKWEVPVWEGAREKLEDEFTARDSAAARAIIEEAMRTDDVPLFVINLGNLTDLASAYLLEPAIADRLTCIWIGGGEYPDGGSEFNCGGDVDAANVVLGSPMAFWQVPKNIYTKMRTGIAELAVKVRPCGDVGEYLYQQLVDFNMSLNIRHRWPKGESWSLGDSPAVALLLDDHEHCFTTRTAPRIESDCKYNFPHPVTQRKIRVYKYVDARFTLEDMFCKLRLFADGEYD